MPSRANSSVTYYSGESVPCACSVDGVMLAVGASPGQGSRAGRGGEIAARHLRRRRHPPAQGRRRRSNTPCRCRSCRKLGEINKTIQDPLARYNAVMALADLFTVEPIAK